MARRRRSASRTRPLTRSISRDKLPRVDRGGERRSRSRPPEWAALLRRLRRLELALVSLLAPEKKVCLDLDALVEDVLRLRNDAGASPVEEVRVLPQSELPAGQGEDD